MPEQPTRRRAAHHDANLSSSATLRDASATSMGSFSDGAALPSSGGPPSGSDGDLLFRTESDPTAGSSFRSDGGGGGNGGGPLLPMFRRPPPQRAARSLRIKRRRARRREEDRARLLALVVLVSFGLVACALLGMLVRLSTEQTDGRGQGGTIDGVGVGPPPPQGQWDETVDTDTLEGVVDKRADVPVKPKTNADARDAERRKEGRDRNDGKQPDGFEPHDLGRKRPDAARGGMDGTAELPNSKAPRDLAFKTRLDGAPPCTKLGPYDITYTLVTQLSHDRLWMMEQHCLRWGRDAPISVVVYTDESAEQLTDELVAVGCGRDQLAVQTLPTGSYGKFEYPVNVMRNMALSRVRTTHVMYVDVDFWESTNLLEVLNMPSVRKELAEDHKLGAIVPAFMVKRQCEEYRDCREENLAKMPNTTQQMIKLVMDKEAGAFDPTNRGGHGSTSYGAWYAQREGEFYDVPCFKSNRYEPYMAFRYCEDLPPFQAMFTGYGKNKMTWVMQMRRVGYDFSQLGRVFLVHYPHLDSKARLEWNKGPKEIFEPVVEGDEKRRKKPKEVKDVDWSKYARGQMDKLYLEFRDWLNAEIPDKARVFPCADAKDEDEDAMLWINKKEK